VEILDSAAGLEWREIVQLCHTINQELNG